MNSKYRLELFYAMLRIRLLEESIAARYVENEMRCPVHLSVGQEAVAVGSCAALQPNDVIVSTHRSHGHYLAKGGNLDAMLAEIYGKITGCCGGRGGSMHLFDSSVGVLASVPIVGSSIPLGVGAALKFRQRNESNVSMVYLGDAATEEGVFHESINFASVRDLPVVFVVENNFYSVYTGLQDRQPIRPLTRYSDVYNVITRQVDGNDIELVYQVAKEVVDEARNNNRPGLVIADTYRWLEHCGPNNDNDLNYRSLEEYEKWVELCPIRRYRTMLVESGSLTDDIEKYYQDQIEQELELAFANARSASFPEPDSAGLRVYA